MIYSIKKKKVKHEHVGVRVLLNPFNWVMLVGTYFNQWVSNPDILELSLEYQYVLKHKKTFWILYEITLSSLLCHVL